MGGIIRPNSPTPAEVRLQQLKIAAALAITQPTILKTVLFDTAAQLTAAGSPASGQVADNCALTPDDLPALVGLSIGGSARDQSSQSNRYVTRNYLWLVLFYQLCDPSIAEQNTALSATWSKIDELPDYLFTNGRLKLSNIEMRGLWSVGHMSDEGAELREWLEKTYSAVIYTLPISTAR